MFGHHNDQQDNNDADEQSTDTPGGVAPEQNHVGDTVAPEPEAEPESSTAPAVPDPADVDPVASEAVTEPETDESWQHPGTPLPDEPETIKDIVSPAGGLPRPLNHQLQAPSYSATSSPIPATSSSDTDDDHLTALSNELVDIRQQALGELAPLIDQLDLPPEDKYRTIMMVIQASDDQSLIKPAYAAAHQIEDEKARAQALLDIVNEINYFSSPHNQN